MTHTALEMLARDPEGFFLMVEGAQIDWASHDNDPIWMLQEMAGLDRSVAAAVDFAAEHPNTLIIVAYATDCSCAVCAVIIVIPWVAVVITEIVTINIIDITISIVILSIAGDFTFVDPHICHQIRVCVVNSCINYCNYNIIITSFNVPCFCSINIYPWSTTCLTS